MGMFASETKWMQIYKDISIVQYQSCVTDLYDDSTQLI